MTLIELLSTLRSRDISVWADGERLRYSAASGALTPDIREELVKHKADLLTFLNETNRVRRVTHTPIAKIPREAELLPSINQRRLWFIDQLQPNTAFNCYKAFRIKGCLRIDSLDQSLNEIVRRHEVLRTTFPAVDGEPFQAIVPSLERGLSLIDLRDIVDVTMRETEVKRIITEEAERPYDLAKGPLFRTHLLCLGTDEYLLLITMHHIVTDGWSMGILVKELTVLYEAFCKGNSSPLPELPVQYVDFAHWQSQRLQDEVLQQELAYWKERLKGAPELMNLPTDRPRPAIQSYQGASEPIVISKGLTAALQALSKNNGVTLFMTLLAAFKSLLYRYTGQEDLMLGSPIAGRRRVEIENLIGLFINTLVLRTDLSGNPSFRELLRRVQEVALGAYAHQDVPFEKLIEELHLERSLSFTSLFQVMFVLQNTPESKLTLLDSTVSQITIDRETAFTDLFLSLTETDEGLQGALSYRTDLFLKSTITRMIAAFQVLLEGIVTDPDQAISTLPIFDENEKHQVLVRWNETTKDYPRDKCLHHLFEEQVERTPEAVAVVFQNKQLTYRELNRKANQLAHYLRKLKVREDVLVGICAERSLETIVGLLGILKAGGAYVPIDPQYPDERLAFLVRDARPSVLLTQQGLVTNLPNQSKKIVYLDAEHEEIRTESAENPVGGARADSLAYVIYTSGSTGEPKGAMTTHRGICNRLLWGREAYKLTNDDRVLHAFSLSFDFATWEIFTALVAGAQLIIAKPGGHLDTGYLVKLIRSCGITLAGFVPAMLTAIFEEAEIASCTSLKRVVSGGEMLPVEFQERFFGTLEDVELQNTYGPTEASIDVTCWICESESVSKHKNERVPIGRPIANTQIYLLDSDLQPVPSGVSGEIYIGGAGLARGYLNLPDLTAEKFIANPFSNEVGARLYKTGDLGRHRRDGNIEFLGRMDNQVKIRGFRIELGEIEAAINQHAAVQGSVAAVRDYTVEDKRLIIYVVPRQKGLTAKDLREFLKQKLPEYMIPSAFVFLDALPVTANGKLDRKALSMLDSSGSEQPQKQQAPRDELELQLIMLWERVLKVRPIGVRDNFFDLGGHSLLAVRLFAQMEKIIGKELPLATLFRAPTVEQLAGLIRQHPWSAPWKSLVAIQPGGSRPPFFCVHAHDGGVLFWRDLARHLGSDQPFYALQPQGLDGKEPLHSRIEEMAAHYIQEIRSLQPEGPYYIGGHCIGGLIAFEMAQQMHAEGETVGLLALFDSYALRSEVSARRSIRHRYRRKVMRFFETVGLHIGNLSVLKPEERFPYVKGKFYKALYKLYMGIGWAETARQRRDILAAASQAARSYQARVYPGKITLFRATELGGGASRDPHMGWDSLGAGVECHRIPGYHAHIVLEPRVRVLARELTAALREAQALGGGEPIVEGRASQQLQLSDRSDTQINAAVS